MCFLNPDPEDYSYFDEEDIHKQASLWDEITMLSSAMIAAIQMQTMNDQCLDRIRAAGKENDSWTARKGELSQLKERQETIPNSDQSCGRKNADDKPAQSKKTTTRCDNPIKMVQNRSRTSHLCLKGWYPTSPKTDVSGYRNCNRTA